MDALNRRQAAAIDKWKGLEDKARAAGRADEEWARLGREKRESVSFSLKIDAELFPIIEEGASPEMTAARLEER